MLRKLDLHGNSINDDGCRIIAESLRINKRLRYCGIFSSEVTGRGFASFIPVVVCDASSIDSTMNSNHTLEEFSPFVRIDILEMNKNKDKKSVAKLKVLRYHFIGNFDLTAEASLDTKSFPHLLAWFGRLKNSESADFKITQSCRSALYRIIRHNPELFEYPSYEIMKRWMGLKEDNRVATFEHAQT